MPNIVADYLRAEIALVRQSKSVGVCHQISHDTAMLAYRRAADELDMLHDRLDELRAAIALEPVFQNKERFGELGQRVNAALGR